VSDLVKTPLRTLTALVALALVAALVGSSCSSVTPQALVVNGFTLSQSDFLDEVSAVVEHGAYLGQPPADTTSDPSTYSTELTSQLLSQRITMVLATQENEKRGNEVSDADLDQAEVLLTQSLGSGGGTSGSSSPDPDGQAVLDQLPSGYRDALVEGVANILVLQSDIIERAQTEEGLRALFDAQQAESGAIEQACARHILIQAGNGQSAPTEAEYAAALAQAEDVVEQLDDGASFATLASQVSDDPGSAQQGGELGCRPQGSYVEEFDDAVWAQPVGEVGEPVRTDFGYHVIVVEKRGEVSFEDVRDQLEQAVAQNQDQLINDWFASAGRDADVWVDPKFGRWDSEVGTVTVPEGAQLPPSTTDTSIAGLLGGAG
jgi:hypothetical protein